MKSLPTANELKKLEEMKPETVARLVSLRKLDHEQDMERKGFQERKRVQLLLFTVIVTTVVVSCFGNPYTVMLIASPAFLGLAGPLAFRNKRNFGKQSAITSEEKVKSGEPL